MRQVVGCRHRICFFQNELAAVFFPLLIFIAAVTDELICKGIGGVIPAFVGDTGLLQFIRLSQRGASTRSRQGDSTTRVLGHFTCLGIFIFGFIIVRKDTDIRMICHTKVQEIVESSLGRAPVERAHGKVIAFAKNEASYLVLHRS